MVVLRISDEVAALHGMGFVHAMNSPRMASWHRVPLHKLVVPLDGASVCVEDGERRLVSRRPVFVEQGIAQQTSSTGPTLAVLFGTIHNHVAKRPKRSGIRVIDGQFGCRVGAMALAAHQYMEASGVSDVANELEPLLFDDARLDRRVARTADAIIANETRRYSSNLLARNVGLSSSRLSHLFALQTGTSLRAFTSFVRIRRGVTQLARGRSIAALAADTGFSDQAHFTRMCRKHFGRTPADVQRMNAAASFNT